MGGKNRLCGLNFYCYKTVDPPFYKATEFMNGENKMWHSNGGIRYIYVRHDGEQTGVFKRFYKNGQVDEISNWAKGKRNGQYERFYQNGQLCCKGTYLNNEFDGLYERFSESGDIEERSNWKNGLRDGPCQEFFDGVKRIFKKTCYKEGKIEDFM